jgi:glycosyltransferase involved in cell wall biosynthesis
MATDRSCPGCACPVPDDPGTDGAGPAAPALLRAWRRTGRRAAPAATARSAWCEVPGDAASGDAAPGEPGWTAAAQRAAALRLLQAGSGQPLPCARPIQKVLVAGFDLRFAADLADRLGWRPDLDVTLDEWPTRTAGSPDSAARLAAADVVFAEWARPNAVWLARHRRPEQRLIVRLHRFELDTRYARELPADAVDAMVYIAPLFGRRIRDELGWPVERLVYIPNFLDVDWLDRPKLPDARFTLGFVGMEFARKRFDLALDLLAAVRREEPRFTLAVRSAMPWTNPYAWRRAAEREYVGGCLRRIEEDPLLRTAVTFHPPGRDMARWYRRIGLILSTSDNEGCHTSVAEGMAGAAVPVVRSWPGAAEVYDKEWVHGSVAQAAAAVLRCADPDRWQRLGAEAREEIRRTHDPVAVVGAWADLLHGDVAAARAAFARYSPLGW